MKTVRSKIYSYIVVPRLFEDSVMTPEKLIEILKHDGLLTCLKVLSDWLRINEDILSACAEVIILLIYNSKFISALNLWLMC